MTITVHELAVASRVLRDAVRDKSYRASPLGLLVGRYIRWKRNGWGARPDTIREYEATLAALCLHYADKAPADFEPPHGYDLLDEFIEERWGARAASTRAKQVSILRDFFRWTVKYGHMTGDASARLDRPRQEDPARPTFSDDDAEAVIRSCSRVRDLVAASLMLSFGLRKGELRRVQLRDYADGYLQVNGKGGRHRELPIVDPILRAAIEQHITDRAKHNPGWRTEYLLHPEKYARGGQDEGLVRIWAAPDRMLSSMAAHNWWVRLLKRAGVPHLKMHAARHTALTSIWRKTGDLELVRQVAGHKYATTTSSIYVHASTRDIERKLRQAFEE